MSPSDQPVEIRLTLTREEAVEFLRSLAYDESMRADFETRPREVLAANGIEVTPPEAIPSTAVAPDPEEIESAIRELSPPTLESPWNRMWRNAPIVALVAKPEAAEGFEST